MPDKGMKSAIYGSLRTLAKMPESNLISFNPVFVPPSVIQINVKHKFIFTTILNGSFHSVCIWVILPTAGK